MGKPIELKKRQNISLRKFTLSDAPEIVRLFGHHDVLKATRGKVWRYTRKDALKYLREKIRQYRRRKPSTKDGEIDTLAYAIERDGRLVGAIGLTLIGSKAEIGYWVGKPYWGQVIATRAIRGFVRQIVHTYKLGRVEAKVFSFNTASMRVLEKCGFKREALIVRDVKVGRRYLDHVLYGKAF